MPRYLYECKVCGFTTLVFHLMDEVYEDCEKCESKGSMTKLLSNANIKTKSRKTQPERVGDLTKEFIEKNKEILKQHKKDLEGKEHDTT